jgi:hypothetical protein
MYFQEKNILKNNICHISKQSLDTALFGIAFQTMFLENLIFVA